MAACGLGEVIIGVSLVMVQQQADIHLCRSSLVQHGQVYRQVGYMYRE